jgi:hypothetical protein
MKYQCCFHKNHPENPTSDMSALAQTINITTRSTTNGHSTANPIVGSLSS